MIYEEGTTAVQQERWVLSVKASRLIEYPRQGKILNPYFIPCRKINLKQITTKNVKGNKINLAEGNIEECHHDLGVVKIY